MAHGLRRVLSSRRLCIGLAVAAIGLFAVSMARFRRNVTGFTVLINFGDAFDERALPAVRNGGRYLHSYSPGYDGQFYAQLAVAPMLRDRALDRALDNPPFRARRILFAWTAYLLGLGRPKWILQIYAVQNIIAWFLLAWLLARWLPPTTPRQLAAWFGCLFGSGLIGSVTLALLEGPSLVLLTLSILAIERGRSWGAAMMLGLAGLGRETNMLAGGILIERMPRTVQDGRRLVGMLALMVLPYVAWSFYVRSLYPSFSFSNPDSFGAPFTAYFGKWATALADLSARGWDAASRSAIYGLVSLTIQAGFLLTSRHWTSPWCRMGAASAIFLPFLSPLPWAGYPGAAVRILVPMTFAFNVLVMRITSRWFWPVVVLGNLSVLKGLHDLHIPVISEWL